MRAMKGASVYHKIKALRAEYSIRDCARELDISINTVQKYAQMSLDEASASIGQQQRRSQFDEARVYILEELGEFPKITATKLLRKVKEHSPCITAKERAFRKYLAPLRKSVEPEQKIRHYEPVLDMEPGHQVQVDMGEQEVCQDKDGHTFKIYFISFVFSYSRMGCVLFQGRPYNTASFIEAHKEAFDYFGGVAKEYVYDQTRLVVINEKYREVYFNEQFHQFALKYEFTPKVCEGYDPQSKGKVERFIRYVKEDFLYGEYFSGIDDMRKGSLIWLDEVANCRIHATTKRQPIKMFEEERLLLNQCYLGLKTPDRRWVDKVGLISFDGNKFSVPYTYQRKDVAVLGEDTQLIICDIDTSEEIARHEIPEGKGHIIKNNNHYRDYRKSVESLTAEALKLFEAIEGSAELIERIKCDNPKIMRDQLRGLMHLLSKYKEELWKEAMPLFLSLPQIRARLLESILLSYKNRHQLIQIEKARFISTTSQCEPQTSALDRSLDKYMEVINHAD